MSRGKHFVPLESNPEVLTAYAKSLGADMSEYQFCDVFGLDQVRRVVDA